MNDHQQQQQNIHTGELVLNASTLETQKASGEFVNNKYLVENICSIINKLRIYQSKNLTKDYFVGMTIQFSDHYYKIDLSKGSDDQFIIERFMIKRDQNNE
ncbi:uncharacterized protein LOC113792485 [Dermatophagoides pteronyssinus]|uniref:Uncharacterized protein n=1 Tax=Dermatophagoides pteronyssinus TaxID=6956 RepID=A0ABQ8J6G4_DERPT|nr:hypothetical protein DERP_010728 [Dermatophagoides pteronyssinus]